MQRRLHFGQIRACPVHSDLIIARINLRQWSPLLHILVVANQHLKHCAADTGANRMEMTVNLRVVCRLAD